MSAPSNPPSSSSSGLWLLRQLGGLLLILFGLLELVKAALMVWVMWAHPAKSMATNETWLAGAAAVATVGLLVAYLGVWLIRFQPKGKANSAGPAGSAVTPTAKMEQPAAPLLEAKPMKRHPTKRWQACNVLQLDAGSRQLWAFKASKNGFALSEELTLPVDSPPPPKLVARDWKDLLQPRLNIALLPVDKVFLRVVHLPVSEFGELVSMVELQMEKLSPLPVTHTVWSIQVLPHTVDNLQTVVVVIAPRDLVERFLGRLEAQGYLADRLEISILDQLLATPITGDGAWLFPATGQFSALVAWWYGGVLQNLSLLHVPTGPNSADALKEQLTQMAWAGELEGWLTGDPQWHLVADEITAATWQPMFRAWLGQPAEVVAPLSEPELAALTANRAARADTRAGVLPPEYATRYHSQFLDRLWMRGLGTVLALYVAAVMVYFPALQFQSAKAQNVDVQAYAMSVQYTNTLKLKKQLEILKDRQLLKYASLDCWRIAAELLPEGFMVESLDFRNGKTFTLRGSAPADQGRQVADFGDKLRKYRDNGEVFFSNVDSQGTHLLGNNLEWGYNCAIARGEAAP